MNAPALLLSMLLQVGGSSEFPREVSVPDARRDRHIPAVVYHPDTVRQKPRPMLVIVSHGYGANAPDSYRRYEYLSRALARAGHVVVSVQHELPGDSLLPLEGQPRVVRLSNWERGCDNLDAVLTWADSAFGDVKKYRVVLVGHSNGGDISALYAQKYPKRVYSLVTLDNRRMPLPRVAGLRVLTIRSSDAAADPGVLPLPQEQAAMDKYVELRVGVAHNDMDDSGTEAQKSEIVRCVLDFLFGQ